MTLPKRNLLKGNVFYKFSSMKNIVEKDLRDKRKFPIYGQTSKNQDKMNYFTAQCGLKGKQCTDKQTQ